MKPFFLLLPQTKTHVKSYDNKTKYINFLD